MTDAGDDPRLTALLDTLRRRGGRVTTARRSIIAALVAADGHVTAEDLATTVNWAHPDIHMSTVYRSLDALERVGIVDHTHLGHGRAVYHLSDDPHQHLVCERCGAVIEVPDATFEALAGDLRDRYGFRIRPSHFAVLGRCGACSAGAG